MIAGLTGLHLLIIVAVIVLIFGAAKLPIFAKSLGQSVKILRHEVHTMQDTEQAEQPVTVPATGKADTTTHTS
jgi:sec-independent protein translocase protein TatA